MRRALITALCLTGCAPSLELRRLDRPEAALGDVQALSLDVTPDKLDKFPDGASLSEHVKARFTAHLAERHIAVCAPAPCGSGTLKLQLRDVHFAAPKNDRTTDLVELGADLTFVSTTGPRPLVHRHHTSIEKLSPTDKMRSLIDDLARAWADRFVAPSRFRTVTLFGGPELNEGVERLKSGDFAGAEARFRAAVGQHPTSQAWFDLGVALEAQNKWVSALDAYEQASKLDSSSPALSSADAIRGMLLR